MSVPGIPHCCGEPLETNVSVPGKEYKCLVCGTFYEFFDGFVRKDPDSMTEEQKKLAKERGYILTDED